MSGLDQQKPVIICGDMDLAHEIDLKNYTTNVGNAGFTMEERQKMTELRKRFYRFLPHSIRIKLGLIQVIPTLTTPGQQRWVAD